MENTYGKTVASTPKDGSTKTIPPARSLEQTEPVGKFGNQAAVASEGRLQANVSVGKKGETHMAKPDEIESLRPAAEEMTNG